MNTLEESGPDAASTPKCANAALESGPVNPVGVARPVLPPKGTCWYCDKALDSVRRFCCKACAAAYDEENGFIG